MLLQDAGVAYKLPHSPGQFLFPMTMHWMPRSTHVLAGILCFLGIPWVAWLKTLAGLESRRAWAWSSGPEALKATT